MASDWPKIREWVKQEPDPDKRRKATIEMADAFIGQYKEALNEVEQVKRRPARPNPPTRRHRKKSGN